MLILITGADPIYDNDTEVIVGYNVAVQTQHTADGKVVTLVFNMFLTDGELINHRNVIERRIREALEVANPYKIIGDEWTMPDEVKKAEVLAA